MKGKRGRPRRSIERINEFGRLIKDEIEHGATLEEAMMAVKRDNPAQRWGCRRTMLRLWAAYQKGPKVPPRPSRPWDKPQEASKPFVPPWRVHKPEKGSGDAFRALLKKIRQPN